MTLISKLRKVPVRAPQFLAYLYHQKLRLGITNTKFDISFTVFRESFLGDQYRLRSFARPAPGVKVILRRQQHIAARIKRAVPIEMTPLRRFQPGGDITTAAINHHRKRAGTPGKSHCFRP